MRPLVAIVGRANVGKSTLFNRLIGRRKAIVHNLAGVTRDLNFAYTQKGGLNLTIIDSGGFEHRIDGDMAMKIKRQVHFAIDLADAVIFLMDVQDGLTPTDIELASILRMTAKPVIYAVNKVDSERYYKDLAEFYALGLDELIPISAEHGTGIRVLTARLSSIVGRVEEESLAGKRIGIAVVGKPNVGKSSLVNRMLGYERVVVDEMSGTTTDAIDTPFEYADDRYILIDTAGIRRKTRIEERFEEYCVFSAIRSIERCNVVLLVIDATKGITTQDMKIAHLIHKKGRGCILIINKWDCVKDKSNKLIKDYTDNLRNRLHFLDYAPLIFVSAKTGLRIKKIFELIKVVSSQMQKRIKTSAVNSFLIKHQERYKPPSKKKGRFKIRYITQTGVWPPAFTAFSNYPENIDDPYKRLLARRIREEFDIENSPIKLSFRSSRVK